MNLLKL